MKHTGKTTRRHFMVSTSAALAASACPGSLLGQQTAPRSAATSPEEMSGGTRPLMKGKTARPLRYDPLSGDFVIRNGTELFNRPLYGPNNPFRVDVSDKPEFSLYLPGHGGNLKFALAYRGKLIGLSNADDVTARYHAGRMIYRVSDKAFEGAHVELEICTAQSGAGIYLRAQVDGFADEPRIICAFGGVSGRKGRRGGDIGCENQPVSEFFKLRPQECRDNAFSIRENLARVSSPAAELAFFFPAGTRLDLADANLWDGGWSQLLASIHADSELPVLIGSIAIPARNSLFLSIEQIQKGTDGASAEEVAPIAERFAARLQVLDRIASSVTIQTPDAYIDCVPAALNIAAEALWDSQQKCVMHGAVAWRSALAGWRGPYVLDAIGAHDRYRDHAQRWLGRQNTSAVTGPEPVVGSPDAGSHLSRTESLLHSNGDLSHNHYDMNLVFFDTLLRHLKWTGDLALAKDCWPALLRHLAWERRLFRRSYKADGVELPLYEAYACIWASDNLQYNGGGASHPTAYNYAAHHWSAELAELLGEDPKLLEQESRLILEGLNRLLWIPEQGCFGESKDILGPQTLYSSPALWTVYHSIDSDAVTRKQAWQMLNERLLALEHVPVHGPDVPPGDWYMLSCSDWLPYVWSLNLLLLAENMHMALALWQAGHSEEAFRIFKGNVLDSMFMGITPGNFHMTSQLDVHRQEAQRDFGDPIGMTSRALVEGLYGIQPNLLHDKMRIAPGFPEEWSHASIEHPDVSMKWLRDKTRDTYSIQTRFPRPVMLSLTIRARSVRLPDVYIDGVRTKCVFDAESVGYPRINLECPSGNQWKIEIYWSQEMNFSIPTLREYTVGTKLDLPRNVVGIDDPQGALRDRRVISSGNHTIFARVEEEQCSYWLPMGFRCIEARSLVPEQFDPAHGRPETIDLGGHLKHQITEIFTRSYERPRSPFCSLSIPENGVGGWAAFNLQPKIDDSGLRRLGGMLQTPVGVPFATPSAASDANCIFLSHWDQDIRSIEIPLRGKATHAYLLMAGTTFPQASRMEHGVVIASYVDGTDSRISLRNPETWWPIEQDYLLDDYLFINRAPLPGRVDLRTGNVRMLDAASFKGRGGMVDGGAATILSMPLNAQHDLRSLTVEATLYGVVLGLLSVTLIRAI